MSARAWVLCCAALLPLPGVAETPADFSGEWVLSNGQADKTSPSDTQAADARSGGGGHGGHGGMGGGGGGGGGMGGGHHGRHAQDSSGSTGANAALPADPRLYANALIIRQSEVVFDIAANGGQRMVYRFDNRNNYGPAYGGTVALTWSAPEMVIETHPDGGGSIEEHYTLTPDGKHLTLHIREQAAGEDSVRESTRTFVRNADDARAAPGTLPP
ncbi:MAG: hypothetical protein P4L92_20600 [Rudaea sp.]|nr:hypothetical protein [Rudaea sp.]